MRHAAFARLMPALLLCAAPALAMAADTPGHDQAPGQSFHITADSLPAPATAPGATAIDATPRQIPRDDHRPIVPAGFTVNLFVEGIPNPRKLLWRDDGELLMVQQTLGRILKLNDVDNDGAADRGGLVMEGSLNPFGVATIGMGQYKGDLLVADQDAVYRLPLVTPGTTFAQVTADGAFGEPKGHVTRSLAIDPKTGDLYVGVGSTENLGEDDPVKATIQRFAADGSKQTPFAVGLRNVTGMAFEPITGALYAVTMERDGMGDELVPDFLSRVDAGDNFGWPYQYTGGLVQPEYKDKGLKLAAARLPDVLFEAHSSPLDIAFIPDSWPAEWRGDALVALHGSSSAGNPRGYKVVRVPFTNGRPDGTYENFMTGFWVSGTAPAEVWGRPASLAFDAAGNLYVGDDLGNTIWRVTPPKG